MDYERGSPKNLVQFSEYNNLAFTDTGVTINDNAKADRSVLWTSDKIERRIAEATHQPSIYNGADLNSTINSAAAMNSAAAIKSAAQAAINSAANHIHNHAHAHPTLSALSTIKNAILPPADYTYYPSNAGSGLFSLQHRNPYRHRGPRVLRLGWWASFLMRRRSHYCSKCCNYEGHPWSSAWKNDMATPSCCGGMMSTAPAHLGCSGRKASLMQAILPAY